MQFWGARRKKYLFVVTDLFFSSTINNTSSDPKKVAFDLEESDSGQKT